VRPDAQQYSDPGEYTYTDEAQGSDYGKSYPGARANEHSEAAAHEHHCTADERHRNASD